MNPKVEISLVIFDWMLTAVFPYQAAAATDRA
jgi:hypothetical protein